MLERSIIRMSASCNGRYCGANAECRDGVCVCVPGYTGDPYDICTRKRPLPGKVMACASVNFIHLVNFCSSWLKLREIWHVFH